MFRRVAALVSGLLLAFVLSGCLPGAWYFEVLDGNSNVGGKTTNLVGRSSFGIVYAGAPHVFYQEDPAFDFNLRHAWFTPGTGWAYESLDGHQNGPNGRLICLCGSNIGGIVYGEQLHVFYANQSSDDLRHGWYQPGVGWSFETLDGDAVGANGRLLISTGFYNQAVLYGGVPHVFTYDQTNFDLRHLWWTGSTWKRETIDGTGGVNLGQAISAVLYGTPHVFHTTIGLNPDLRHTWWTGSIWKSETLDGHQNGPNGRVVAGITDETTAILYGGLPHVFYRDLTNSNVRHAWWNGNAWYFEVLDGDGGAGGRTANAVGEWAVVAIAHNGFPHVFYLDNDLDDVRHASFDGSAWSFESVDGDGQDGGTSNVIDYQVSAFSYGSQLDVLERDQGAGDLRHVWFG